MSYSLSLTCVPDPGVILSLCNLKDLHGWEGGVVKTTDLGAILERICSIDLRN